ncbi:hypothetical protein [Carbonactinospora thermoautotrophica]|uniref:hypothetical protein n=1 Tax=Carbonactinospora thermoautotrophica TaxID=1469144 RepID=UPI0022709181|nr:hypothetical protein [Carbonactinospora thermoautotrophica]
MVSRNDIEQTLVALQGGQPTTPPATIRSVPDGTPLPVRVPGRHLEEVLAQ